jgi:hypothetical protein
MKTETTAKTTLQDLDLDLVAAGADKFASITNSGNDNKPVRKPILRRVK